MATRGFSLRIPPEIISLIIYCLPDTRDISRSSLVSRTWYKQAFPHLHRHITIKTISHLEMLASRIESKGTENQLGPCIRAMTLNLSFDDASHPCFIQFERAVSGFVRLVFLEWKRPLLSNSSTLFKSFQEHCPSLQYLIMYYAGASSEVESENVFVFRNLKKLYILWSHIETTGLPRVPNALTNMIQRSPELYELQFDIAIGPGTAGTLNSTWSPSKLFQHIETPLPRLRRLAIGGSYTIDWAKFIEGPSKCALRRFIEHHPLLDTVRLERAQELSRALVFRSTLAERLFSSVKDFTGPLAICAGLIASRHAKQLKRLHIVARRSTNRRSPDEKIVMDTLVKSIRRPLPKLRELALILDVPSGVYDRVVLQANMWDKLLGAMPNVRSIILTLPIEWTGILQYLHRIPRLTSFSFVDKSRPRIDDVLAFKRNIAVMFDTCPMLLRITGLRSLYKEDGGCIVVNRTIDRFGATNDISFGLPG